MLIGALVTTAALLLQATVQAAPFDVLRKRAVTFPYGSQKVRGVNLGGWFVLEPWISPSLFGSGSAVDEYNLCRQLGKTACRQKLSQHWATFYTEEDFKQIAGAGLNHVRIPLGYWAVSPLNGDPYVQGQIAYLDKAISWAGAHGLKVWIDLHGAPGSQNGFDNSGHRDQINWQTGGNVAHTVKVIKDLAKKYAKPKWNSVVTAIELVNEPLGPVLDLNKIKQYYYDGWGAIHDYGDIAVVISDAFRDPTDWNGFMSSGFKNVILDTHLYQVFSAGQLAMDIGAHVSSACGIGKQLGGVDKWTVIGEWSGALTDCTKWLNGIGRGARYDNTFPGSWYIGSCAKRTSGSISQFSDAERKKTRRYIEAQLDAYERGAGWIFWTWKTEAGSPEWEMRDLIWNGVFPQPLSSRKYPNQCGF